MSDKVRILNLPQDHNLYGKIGEIVERISIYSHDECYRIAFDDEQIVVPVYWCEIQRANDVRALISDESVDMVHGNSDFGLTSKRDVIRFSLLKIATGYAIGSGSTRILEKHLLINQHKQLTHKGRQYLWAAFIEGNEQNERN